MGGSRKEAGLPRLAGPMVSQPANLHFAGWHEVLDHATQLVRTRALFVPGEMAVGAGGRVEVTLHMPDGMRLFLTGTVTSVATTLLSGATILVDEKYGTDLMLLEQLALAALESRS